MAHTIGSCLVDRQYFPLFSRRLLGFAQCLSGKGLIPSSGLIASLHCQIKCPCKFCSISMANKSDFIFGSGEISPILMKLLMRLLQHLTHRPGRLYSQERWYHVIMHRYASRGPHSVFMANRPWSVFISDVTSLSFTSMPTRLRRCLMGKYD